MRYKPIDAIFQTKRRQIIFNHRGRVIGEVYTLPDSVMTTPTVTARRRRRRR